MTLQEARELISLRTREGIDSAIIEKELIDSHLNDCHQMIVAEKYYPFYDKTFVFSTSKDSYLVGDIDSTSTNITVQDATFMPMDCVVSIENDFINIDNKAGNTFDVDFMNPVKGTHKTGIQVRRIYDLIGEFNLTNYKKPIHCSVAGKELQYYDGRGMLKDEGYYTIIDGFLILPFNTDVNNCVFKFEQQPNVLVNDGDLFVIPDIYKSLLIEYVIYKIKLDLYPETSQLHYSEYMRIKRHMQADYARQTGQTGKRVKSIYY